MSNTTAHIVRFAFLGWLGSLMSPAFALDCREIVELAKSPGMTPPLVVQVIENSTDNFSASDIQCLEDNRIDAQIISAAKSRMMQAPSANTAPAAPVDRFDQDAGLGSQRQLTDGDYESSAGGPAKVEEAIELYKNKKLLSASKALYDLLAQRAYPDQESKLQFYLGRTLYDLEMYHSAQSFFKEVLKKGAGDPYFRHALPKMVAVSRYTGDDTDLLKVVVKIRPEDYPREAQDQMYYLMGVRLYEDDKLAEAQQYFAQISPKDELYLKTRYFDGVIFNRQGRLKSAVKAFNDVIQASRKVEIFSDRDLLEMELLRDLSLMNIARIYYAIQNFEESTKHYSLVPHESPVWPQALFEDAWSNFMQSDLNFVLGQILTIQSPFYNESAFIPEGRILRALTFFNLCEYEQVDTELLKFEGELGPIYQELVDVVSAYSTKESRRMADQAFDMYYTNSGKNTLLPKALMSSFLQNRSLAGIIRHLDLMEGELSLISEQKIAWRDTVGAGLAEKIESDLQIYKRRAGLKMLAEMADMANYLEDLINQSQLIRFEVVSAKRTDYTYKMSNPELLNTGNSMDIDFATSQEFIYWPFNGEFWKDELGYYHYTEQGSCN